MDNSKLKQLADAKFDFAVTKLNLKERTEQQITVAHNGGLFKATPTLMTFLASFRPNIIEDEYQNPIMVDSEKLLNELTEAYNYAMNAWYVDFEKYKKVRKV